MRDQVMDKCLLNGILDVADDEHMLGLFLLTPEFKI